MDTRLGGWKAGCMFVLSLVGYVAQSQVTQHVQADLHYRQPYFIFYLAHSSFLVIFPLHLWGLCWFTKVPPKAYITGLKDAIHDRLLSNSSESSDESGVDQRGDAEFPTARFLRTIALLTAGITCPSLLWYVSVSLTSISDVTAILNTNAFWAYLLSVWMASAPFQSKRLLAVVIAVFGVFLIVYSGSSSDDSDKSQVPTNTPRQKILGDALTLVASIAYAVYQTTYKRYVSLPNTVPGNDEDEDKEYEPLPTSDSSTLQPSSPTRRRTLSLADDPPQRTRARERAHSRTSLWTSVPTLSRQSSAFSSPALAPTPSSTPEYTSIGTAPTNSIYPAFGLHPNFITSCLGLTTVLFLWPPLVLFHYTDIEPFALPQGPEKWEIWAGLVMIGLCGSMYNAGFMILLSLWGPTLATVGNLLTIVLVLISDTLFGHGLETLTLPSLLGAGAIVAAFGVLVIEERNSGRKERLLTVAGDDEV